MLRLAHEFTNLPRDRKKLSLVHAPNDISNDRPDDSHAPGYAKARRLFDEKAWLCQFDGLDEVAIHANATQLDYQLGECNTVLGRIRSLFEGGEHSERLNAEVLRVVEAQEPLRLRNRLW